jgi:hypothetical protein
MKRCLQRLLWRKSPGERVNWQCRLVEFCMEIGRLAEMGQVCRETVAYVEGGSRKLSAHELFADGKSGLRKKVWMPLNFRQPRETATC